MSSSEVLLAFDTSTPVGSVAVSREGTILARAVLLEAGEHASHLVPMIAEVLEEADVARSRITGIVAGRGPGSFTGVRIAAATARGLCASLGIPLWPCSSLAAAAASYGAELPESLESSAGSSTEPNAGSVEGRPRYVLFDARADRVYGACYRMSEEGMETLVDPHAATIGEVLEGALPEDVVFCGDAVLRHRAVFEAAEHECLSPPAGVPLAEGLLRVHAMSSGRDDMRVGARWQPEYLRGTSARRPSMRWSGSG